jgi:uncharacterized protein (TIGR03437 family)
MPNIRSTIYLSRIALGSALVCFLAATLQAQQDRITSRVDSSRMVGLKGHLNPYARPEDDRGLVDPSLEIAYATLHLKPSAAQQAALEKLLIEQQDSSSPNYHRWLTPEEYANRFGLSRADIGSVVDWLEAQGLKVNDIARGRRWITFSGSAASVGRGFRTEFHRYLADGEEHFANATVPSIPEALADVVADVEGLDDYYPAPAGRSSRGVRPAYTNSSGAHYLTPDDIATIYDLNPLYSAGFDGSGQTIAIVGTVNIDLAQIRNYRTTFKLPAGDPKMMLVGPDPGTSATADEAYLDLELSSAVARNATLVYVFARSPSTAAQYAVDQRVAPVISESYATCEPATTTFQRAIAQQANAEGITWLAGTGDVGAAGCERQSGLQQASKGLAVASPASIPEVTAVGGTEFDEGGGTYWNRTNSNYGSATSYIPEKAWNDSVADNELAASTGGASMFYPKPWWQSGPGVPNDGARDVPDVSMSASWTHDPYLIYAPRSSGLYGQGGTSAATPVFASIVAILNQYLVSTGVLSQPGLGNINPTLYRLAQTAPDAFHDVVGGDNIVPCVQGTPDCVDGSLGFTAGPGYDLATGLGSIDAYKLATSWTSGTATSTTVTATPATVALNGGNVQLTATVKASAGTPAGEIAFLVKDTSVGTATLSGSGATLSATLTLSAMQLPVGTDAVTAVYGGSGNLNASAGTTTITVTAPTAVSAVVISVNPNPVYQQPPDANGHRWFYTLTLTNESAVSTKLTEITINGTDYSSNIASWFGTATIAGNKSISVSLSTIGSNPPFNRVFGSAGTDTNGATWSQQITVPFVAQMRVAPSLLLLTPGTLQANPAADPSCRWLQPLVLEEQGGFDVRLTKLTWGSTDLTDQWQGAFGTTTIAAFGRLEGWLCWDSSSATGTHKFSLSGAVVQDSRTVSTTVSTALASTASAVTASASPALVDLSAGSASVSLSFNGGSPPWTAKVSPANCTTEWLTVSPVSGTGAAQLNLTASSAGLSNGVYSAMLMIESSAMPQWISVPVVLVVGGSPSVTIGSVSNAASGQGIAAPGMLMSVLGTNLAPAAQHADSGTLPLTMQGVTATVNGFSAPLMDVDAGQLTIQVPYETGAGTAILGVNNNGQVAFFPFQVAPSAPGIFMTSDGTSQLVPNSTGQRGQALLANVTGEGDVAPALITGKAPTTTDITQLPAPTLPVTLTVGGVPATISFIGIPRRQVGTTQINFTVPPDAPLGAQPVVVTVGGVDSPPVMLTVTQ